MNRRWIDKFKIMAIGAFFVSVGSLWANQTADPDLGSQGIWLSGRPGFLPTDIGSLELWVRAHLGVYKDSGCTDLAEDSDDVLCWKDYSGKGRNLTVPFGTNYATYIASSLNGLPGIDFNDGPLMNSSGLAQPWTYFSVVETAPSNSVNSRLISDDTPASSVSQISRETASIYTRMANSSTPNQKGISNSTNYTIKAYVNGDSSTLSLNCGSEESGDDPGDNDLTSISIGDEGADDSNIFTSGWTAPMYEIIIYSDELSLSETLRVCNYLKEKWGHY